MTKSARILLPSLVLAAACASTPPWGDMSQQDIAAWKTLGFDAPMAQAWHEKGFDPATAGPWHRHGFDLTAALAWQKSTFTAPEADQWRSAGFGLDEAKKDRGLGLAPIKAAPAADAESGPPSP